MNPIKMGQMRKRPLGKTNIELSELGYGCAALFGKSVMGKEGIPEEKAFQIMKTAIESGVNFFDTGFNYGFSEERVGRLLNALCGGV